MKPIVFLLAAVAVLGLGFGLVLYFLAPGDLVTTEESRSNVRPGPAPASAEGVPHAELALAPDAETEAALEGSPARAAAAERAPVVVPTARTVGDWASGELRVVRGGVATPPGAPVDPTLAVVSLKSEMTAERIYGRYGALDTLATPPSRSEDREEIAGATDAEGAAAKDASRLLAVAPVAPDGSFELPFPADRKEGWIAVDGRFLYSKEATRVALDGEAHPELEVQVGGWLTGTVRLPPGVQDPGAALREVTVVCSLDPERFGALDRSRRQGFKRRTAVDEQGRFELRGLPAGTVYLVHVESKHVANATVSDIQLEGGKNRHVEIDLVQGGRVTGRVVDGGGAPVAGAKIEAATGSIFGFAPFEAGETKTGADGWFELAHVTPGKVQIVARKDGYLGSAPKRIEVRDGQSTEGVLMELSQGARVAGVVLLADGTPAAGVEIDLGFDPEAMSGMGAFNATRGADGEAKADERGRFEITGLGRGPFLVTATHELDGAELSVRRSGVKPDTLDLELVLRPAPVLAGHVRSSIGTPLTRFHVRAEAQSLPFWLAGDAVQRDFEDPEGGFELTGLTEGRWRVRASADGWSASPWRSVDLPRAPGEPALQLTLEPEAVAAGVVLSPDGEPIAGAVVRREQTMIEAIANIGSDDNIGSGASMGSGADEARSGQGGAFTLRGLGTGTVSLVAVHERFVDSEAVVLDVVSGRRTEDVVLRLRRGGTLTGIVYDDEGKPAPGTSIVLQETATFVPTMLKSGPDGTFLREELKPGRWQVTAMSSGFDMASMFGDDEPDLTAFMTGMKTTTAAVVEGEVTHVELGAPPSDPVRVTGRIGHGGEPVKAVVAFLPEGIAGFGSMKFTTTNADGRFDVVLDEPGSYLMQVQVLDATMMSQNSTELRQEIPEVEEHAIEVELPMGRISGRVQGPDGKPLENARVTLFCDEGIGSGSLMGGRYVEQITDAEGRYEILYLAPRTYQIAAGGALAGGLFGNAAEAGREVRSGLRLAEGEWIRELDFRLKAAGELTGRVVDATGAPIAGAAIFVRDQEGRLLERFSMISSDSSGLFRYRGVAPGRYTVSARTEDLASPESATVEVPESGTGNAQITVAVGTILKVGVVDDEDGIVDASIRVLDEEGRLVNGMIAYQDIVDPSAQLFTPGEHRVGPLPPGRYTVVADVNGSTVTKPLTLTGQTERKLKLRFR